MNFKAQEIVREFTVGAANAVCDNGSLSNSNYPNRPVLADSNKSSFISKMVMSELLELLLTIHPDTQSVKKAMHEIVDDLDLPTSSIPNISNVNNGKDDEVSVIEAQMDAMADIMYYILDFCTKQGYNIDRFLTLVHEANMAKKHSDNLFHKRNDGKVVKPPGWKEADVRSEVIRQINEGSW